MKYMLLIGACFVLSISEGTNESVEPTVMGSGTIDLLEGESLEKWSESAAYWSLKEGHIIGDTGGKKIDTADWIYTKKMFADFVFTCEMKLTGDKRRNTGIYYRVNTFQYDAKRAKNTFEAPSGYEFDAAYHRPGKKNYRGSLGDWYARPSLRILADQQIINRAYKEEDWNRMTIRARGNRLEYWINGIKVMDFIDPDPKASREGLIGFQIHNGSVMKVEYRNIRVRALLAAQR